MVNYQYMMSADDVARELFQISCVQAGKKHE